MADNPQAHRIPAEDRRCRRRRRARQSPSRSPSRGVALNAVQSRRHQVVHEVVARPQVETAPPAAFRPPARSRNRSGCVRPGVRHGWILKAAVAELADAFEEQTAAAAAMFSDSALPGIGMATTSRRVERCRDRPAPSLPGHQAHVAAVGLEPGASRDGGWRRCGAKAATNAAGSTFSWRQEEVRAHAGAEHPRRPGVSRASGETDFAYAGPAPSAGSGRLPGPGRHRGTRRAASPERGWFPAGGRRPASRRRIDSGQFAEQAVGELDDRAGGSSAMSNVPGNVAGAVDDELLGKTDVFAVGLDQVDAVEASVRAGAVRGARTPACAARGSAGCRRR